VQLNVLLQGMDVCITYVNVVLMLEIAEFIRKKAGYTLKI